jgi:hypothetical protein
MHLSINSNYIHTKTVDRKSSNLPYVEDNSDTSEQNLDHVGAHMDKYRTVKPVVCHYDIYLCLTNLRRPYQT